LYISAPPWLILAFDSIFTPIRLVINLSNQRDSHSRHCTHAQLRTWVAYYLACTSLIREEGLNFPIDEGAFTEISFGASLTPAHLMASISGDDIRVSER